MAALLSGESLKHHYGPRTLFEGINLFVNEGERIGMIGPNGAGKSTLLKILAGVEIPTEGNRSIRKNARVGYLPQQDLFSPEATVRSAMEEALAGEPWDEHQKRIRAESTLSRLRFDDFEKPVDKLSGGWRKRLAIARLIALEPDLVLFDEPTNHLDVEGIVWLEQFLLGAGFTFLIVSHDRYLLERACNRVIELSEAYPQGSFSVDGNYSRFLEKREEFLAGQRKQQQSLAGQVRREIEWLRRGPKARTTKAQARIDKAGQMQEDLGTLQNRNEQGKRVTIDFTGTSRKANKQIILEKVAKTLGGRQLFSDLSFYLEPGQKLGLLGTNGSGKSTLVKLMMGQLNPDEGNVIQADGVRVALFDQTRAQLDQTETLKQALLADGDHVYFQGKSTHIEAWARRFLFRSEQLNLPLSQLSGGEQARVLLARMMLQPADVLILDEPTNDLDIPSLEVLEEGLREFPGSVVLITHDRYLLEQVATSILGLDGQGSFGLYVSYDHWQEATREAAEAKKKAEAAARAKPAKPAAAPAAKPKKLSYKEKQELEAMEERILEAEGRVEEIQGLLNDPAVSADYVRLQEQCKALEEAQAEVAELYARWEELEAKA